MYGSSDSCPYVNGRFFPVGTEKNFELILANRSGEVKIVKMTGSPEIHKSIRDIPCFSLDHGFGCHVQVEGFLSNNRILACSIVLYSDNMGTMSLNCSFKNDKIAQWIIDSRD